MSWLKKNKKYGYSVNDPDCPCPTDGTLFSYGCVYNTSSSPNWCQVMKNKWDYFDCSNLPDTTKGNIEYVFCLAGDAFMGLGLTLLQYGALPAVIYGTAVAAGYIKSAES